MQTSVAVLQGVREKTAWSQNYDPRWISDSYMTSVSIQIKGKLTLMPTEDMMCVSGSGGKREDIWIIQGWTAGHRKVEKRSVSLLPPRLCNIERILSAWSVNHTHTHTHTGMYESCVHPSGFSSKANEISDYLKIQKPLEVKNRDPSEEKKKCDDSSSFPGVINAHTHSQSHTCILADGFLVKNFPLLLNL